MKTVIEMAREAGFEAYRGRGLLDHVPEDVFAATVNITREIERFAELVRADEREACAKVCESEWSNVAERMYGEECAAAIRARSNT